MPLRPEQVRALEYLQRRGTNADPATLRKEMEAALRSFEDEVAGVPASLRSVRPAPGAWSVHEIVDHLTVSHRRAAGELRILIAGRRPEGGPIPASLQSEDPHGIPWPELFSQLKDVHETILEILSEDTPLSEARAPVVLVVKTANEAGELVPVEWIEELDWKAYAQGLRVHTLEHLSQVQRTVDRVAREPADLL